MNANVWTPTSIQTDTTQCFCFQFYKKKKKFSCKITFSMIWQMLHNTYTPAQPKALALTSNPLSRYQRSSSIQPQLGRAWERMMSNCNPARSVYRRSLYKLVEAWTGERKKRKQGSISSLAFHPTSWSQVKLKSPVPCETYLPFF